MSFYVDTQEEAIKIGLGHFRPDLAKLSLEEIKNHPDVTVKEEKISNPVDYTGKYAIGGITLDIKDVPVILGSAPFRSGFDIWAFDRKSGMGFRICP